MGPLSYFRSHIPYVEQHSSHWQGEDVTPSLTGYANEPPPATSTPGSTRLQLLLLQCSWGVAPPAFSSAAPWASASEDFWDCWSGFWRRGDSLTTMSSPQSKARVIGLVQPLKDVSVTAGESATFECELSYEGIAVEWFLGGTKVEPSDRVSPGPAQTTSSELPVLHKYTH